MAAEPDNPQIAVVHYDIGRLLRDQGKLDEAMQHARRALELDPKYALAHFGIGNVLITMGQSDEAIEAYHEAIELDPHLSTAYINLGHALFSKGAYEECANYSRKGLQFAPNNAQLHHNLGCALRKQGEFREAITLFERAIEFDPQYAQARSGLTQTWQELGWKLYREGDYEASIHALETSCAAQGNGIGDAFQWLFVAMAHAKLGHREEARMWLAKSLEHERVWPKELSGYRIEAIAALGTEDAAKAYTEALDKLPAQPGWNSPRRRVCRDLALTMDVFDAVAVLRPDDADLLIGLGQYLALQSRWDAAVKAYSRVSEFTAAEESAFEYACLLLLNGDTDGYRQLCKRLLEQSARDLSPYSAFVLARSCAIQSELVVPADQLIAWAEQAAGSARRAWDVHVIGVACYREGDFDRAQQLLEESNNAGWSPQGTALNEIVLAMICHRRGDQDAAVQRVNRARELIQGASTPPPDWLEYHVLLREAEAIIGQTPAHQQDLSMEDPSRRGEMTTNPVTVD